MSGALHSNNKYRNRKKKKSSSNNKKIQGLIFKLDVGYTLNKFPQKSKELFIIYVSLYVTYKTIVSFLYSGYFTQHSL